MTSLTKGQRAAQAEILVEALGRLAGLTSADSDNGPGVLAAETAIGQLTHEVQAAAERAPDDLGVRLLRRLTEQTRYYQAQIDWCTAQAVTYRGGGWEGLADAADGHRAAYAAVVTDLDVFLKHYQDGGV